MTGVGFGVGTLVLVPQLDATTLISASIASAVHRKIVKPVPLAFSALEKLTNAHIAFVG
jgi:hypothetical protein